MKILKVKKQKKIQLNGQWEAIEVTPKIKDNKSIFECSTTGDWFEMGSIVLETKPTNEEFEFSNNKILKLLSHYKNDEIFSEGILIEHGERINIIAVRTNCSENNRHKNVYKFYTDSKVVSIYNLLSIPNFILHLHQTEIKPPKDRKDNWFDLKYLVYSNKKHKNSKNCNYKEISQDLYNLEYRTGEYDNFGELAMRVYNDLDCTKRNVSKEKQQEIEELAFCTNVDLDKNEKYSKKIEDFDGR